MALFESYERREKQVLAALNKYGINTIEEAAEVTKAAGLDVYKMVEGIQPICFENAKWAYTVGAAIAIKKGCKKASDAAAAIGEGLQAFCIPGSVADQRKVGLGHGNLGKMLLEEDKRGRMKRFNTVNALVSPQLFIDCLRNPVIPLIHFDFNDKRNLPVYQSKEFLKSRDPLLRPCQGKLLKLRQGQFIHPFLHTAHTCQGSIMKNHRNAVL